MKKIISYVSGLALAATPLAALTSAPAHAQTYTGRAICRAASPSAVGYGVSYDVTTACNRAIYECVIRTPSYQTCSVTRWFWEVM